MNKLKELRIKKGCSMATVSRELNIPYTTYVSYEKGEREPNSEMLIKLANYHGVSVDFLIGRNSDLEYNFPPFDKINNFGIIPLPKTKSVPLVGTIACGTPILAEENIESYVNVEETANVDFALRCKGDSMINARIFDGDIVYIRRQSDVENGEIAAVLIDNEATLKKVYKSKNKIVLRPCNPMYDDIVFVNEQLNNVYILGKAILFTSVVRHG